MSRVLSLAMLIAAYAQESEEVVMPLLTIDHPELEEPLRFCLNGEDITSRDEVYHAAVFDLLVPDDTADRPAQANLSFPNVGREMTALMEASLVPPTVTIEIILASNPDQVEISWPALQVQPGTKYNLQTATAALAGRRLNRESYPKGIISPSYFAGAF
ncbi:MAG: hypothetical protein A2Y80_02185 [Deltaproteobacteria bacterium RBG_13_58_19]|nr:MAG: hypothetical protein A2Y80_02185 [Deltaproteobacteria bacterium RBG_13_58_19]